MGQEGEECKFKQFQKFHDFRFLKKLGFVDMWIMFVSSVLTSQWEKLFKWTTAEKVEMVKRDQNTVTGYFVAFSLGQLR